MGRSAATAIDAAKLDCFVRLMNHKLDAADDDARNGYIRYLIDTIGGRRQDNPDRWQRGILLPAIADEQIEN
ncbi:hypothetical protein KQX63_16235 [Rhodopseudomonas palustris]|uniref:hypothetical protein n=1 Tax=Rhodopseudomonas palustris TaxID=1076 RepID=UPI0021F339E7|nr:hypothetical protein [Rhodopseudomonas palustris]UYO42937.1 hypothetical protein KQX63_16235 [Rhodopseudomonas palustris]